MNDNILLMRQVSRKTQVLFGIVEPHTYVTYVSNNTNFIL